MQGVDEMHHDDDSLPWTYVFEFFENLTHAHTEVVTATELFSIVFFIYWNRNDVIYKKNKLKIEGPY